MTKRSDDGRAARWALALVLAMAGPAPIARARGFDPQPESMDALHVRPDALPPYPLPGAPSEQLDDAAPAIAVGRPPSGVVERLADWVAETGDNGDLPFLIVDKLGARIFAFGVAGDFRGSAPVLVGLARGDDSAPGVGGLKLAQISSDQRTTPAGRFVAEFGASAGHGVVLWVDLADAISLHPVMSVSADEHRFQRIKSSDPDQHRISYGCINVPKIFYDDVVLTTLAGGNAVVYVLPDTKTIRAVFPAFADAVDGRYAADPPHSSISRADLNLDARDGP